MISSRCDTTFPDRTGETLTDIRVRLAKRIEGMKPFGRQLFEVWINERGLPAGMTEDSWEECLKAVRDCDIFIAISTGEAGWASTGGDIGICHAELMEAMATGQEKVRVIPLKVKLEKQKENDLIRNERFTRYVDTLSAFRGGSIKTVVDLEARVMEAIHATIVALTQNGGKAAASGRFDRGQALDWSRLDYRDRKKRMEEVVTSALSERDGARVASDSVILPIADKDVAFWVHAIPAAFNVAPARELVGRPFLQDHERVSEIKGAGGPVHIIACHRSATETQAISLLGFSDATIVRTRFGIYVSDPVQKIQFIFLADCRDETHTRHALQRFFAWLEQTDEAKILSERASSRQRIVQIIAKEF